MERLDGTIRGTLRSVGVPDVGALAEITRAWPEAVGAAIACAAWPLRIARDGTLHVATASSAWAFELGLLSGEILAKLRAAVGDAAPAAVKFAPGPLPEPSRAVGAEPLSTPVADAETRALAARLTASMSDAELRQTIARAAAASLSRRA